MVPDFALRIQSMLRAMREVIMPAIAADQRLALDQAAILVGNLRLMAEQCENLYQYELVELRESAVLVRALLAAVEAQQDGVIAAAAEVLARAAPIAELPIPPQASVALLTKELKIAADGLLQVCLKIGSPRARAAAGALVMAQSQTQIARERRWFKAAGFELEPDKMPPLDEVLT